MPTLINGVTLPVATGIPLSLERVGGMQGRGAGGSLAKSHRKALAVWSCELGPMTLQEGQAWCALLQGDGDTFNFASTNSDLGVLVSAGSGTVAANVLTVAASISWDLKLGTNWTVSFQRATTTYTLTSAGAHFTNGVATAPGGSGISVTGGVLTLSAGTYRRGLVLRSAIPASWAPGIHTRTAAGAFTALPALDLTGDLGTYAVTAEVETQRLLTLAGSQHGVTLTVGLRQKP